MAKLKDYLKRAYPIATAVDESGGWAIWFPDLPGCMSHAETLAEIGTQAAVAFRLWMTSEFERGHPIPDPTITKSIAMWAPGAMRLDTPAED